MVKNLENLRIEDVVEVLINNNILGKEGHLLMEMEVNGDVLTDSQYQPTLLSKSLLNQIGYCIERNQYEGSDLTYTLIPQK